MAFYKVEYRLKQSDGGMDLKLRMKEKPPITLRSSFHYDNTFSAGIVLNIQIRDLLLKSSRTILAADISENPRFRFDYYKYTGRKKKAAFNLRYDYHNEQIPIYNKGEKSDVESDIENSISMNLLTTQSLKNSFLLGVNYESNKFNSEFNGLFPEGLDYGEFNFTRARFSYTRNSLNNQNYPTKGSGRLVLLDAYYKSDYNAKYVDENDTLYFDFSKDPNSPAYFSESQANDYLDNVTPELYGSVYLRSIDYLNISDNFQMIPVFTLGLIGSIDSVNTLFNEFKVGGQQMVKISDTKFAGLHYAEKFLENFATGGFFLQNVILKNFFLKYGANVLIYHDYIPLNDLNEFDADKMLNEQTFLGYGGEITYKSFIGPISFGMSSNTDDGYVRYYVSLGYSFNYSD